VLAQSSSTGHRLLPRWSAQQRLLIETGHKHGRQATPPLRLPYQRGRRFAAETAKVVLSACPPRNHCCSIIPRTWVPFVGLRVMEDCVHHRRAIFTPNTRRPRTRTFRMLRDNLRIWRGTGHDSPRDPAALPFGQLIVANLCLRKVFQLYPLRFARLVLQTAQ
jgi:hypothetical protein